MKAKKPTLKDLSVIIPIGDKDESWKRLASDLISLPLATEIIFVATQFDPSALAILSKGLAPGRKVRWVTAPRGRALQMNAGAEQATKPYLWFLHSDSILENLSLLALEHSLSDHPDAVHYFQLKFSESLHGLMKLNEWGIKFRSQILKMPFGDQGFVMSRELFKNLGGYSVTAPYGEDHLLIWKARQSGVTLACISAHIRTSARKYESRGWLKTTLLHQWLTYKQAIPEWVKLVKKSKVLALICFLAPSAFAQTNPVWIDTDIAIGGRFKDVDDGYALAHALTQYADRIAGISVSYGNSHDVQRSHDLSMELLELTGQTQIPVYLGAQSAEDLATPASEALALELQNLKADQKLTILALGRLTNIQGALRIYPEGAARIDDLVFIGGRREESEPTFGRFQIIVTDSNFWGDEASFSYVLDQKIPLTLISPELAQAITITGHDLRVMKRQTPLTYWLAERSKLWLRIWQFGLGSNGFNPFDLLASAYLTQRQSIHCDEQIPLKILALPDFHFLRQGRYLRNRPVVSYAYQDTPFHVRYCDAAEDDLQDKVFAELSEEVLPSEQ